MVASIIAIATIAPIYAKLKSIEDAAADRSRGLADGVAAMLALLRDKGLSYDEFVFSLAR